MENVENYSNTESISYCGASMMDVKHHLSDQCAAYKSMLVCPEEECCRTPFTISQEYDKHCKLRLNHILYMIPARTIPTLTRVFSGSRLNSHNCATWVPELFILIINASLRCQHPRSDQYKHLDDAHKI